MTRHAIYQSTPRQPWPVQSLRETLFDAVSTLFSLLALLAGMGGGVDKHYKHGGPVSERGGRVQRTDKDGERITNILPLPPITAPITPTRGSTQEDGQTKKNSPARPATATCSATMLSRYASQRLRA